MCDSENLTKSIIHYQHFDKSRSARCLCIGERFEHYIVADNGFHQLPIQNKSNHQRIVRMFN